MRWKNWLGLAKEGKVDAEVAELEELLADYESGCDNPPTKE